MRVLDEWEAGLLEELRQGQVMMPFIYNPLLPLGGVVGGRFWR